VDTANRPPLTSIEPFFIVSDLRASIAFYRDQLGFELVFATPDDDPFFAILGRDRVRLMIKAILPEVRPSPNHRQHPWAKWDAFVHTPDPDGLAAEFTARGVAMSMPLADADEQLRGFEIQDPDGYVMFFGRPK
jgi:catechol 2,3-dioxygenase-like lactoylglutathione lyase family enzyme